MEKFPFDGTYQECIVVVYSPAKQGGWLKPVNPEVRQAIYKWRTDLVIKGIENQAGEDVLFHRDNVVALNGNRNYKKISLQNGDRVRCLVRVHRGPPEHLCQRVIGNPVEVIV